MRPGDVVHTVERRTHGAQRWQDVTATCSAGTA